MKEIIKEVCLSFTNKNIDQTIKNPRSVIVIRTTTPSLLKIVDKEGKQNYYPITSINSFQLKIKEVDERVLM